MKSLYLKILVAVIAVALVKVAFFPAGQSGQGIVPSAHAGAIIEWNEGRRIVTTSADGATTYVWDYDEKTKVRRYTIQGNKLVLETFRLAE